VDVTGTHCAFDGGVPFVRADRSGFKNRPSKARTFASIWARLLPFAMEIHRSDNQMIDEPPLRVATHNGNRFQLKSHLGGSL
jgi:hypothetical protein